MKEIKNRILRDIKEFWTAALMIAGYGILMNLIFDAFCPMVILTGFPCPGCGLTRSVCYLLTGHLQQSFYINPMGIPIACLIFYFLWNRYIIGRKAKGMMYLIGAAAVLLILLYVWRMILFFPDRVPYVYKEKNITSEFLPFYEQILHEWKIL